VLDTVVGLLEASEIMNHHLVIPSGVGAFASVGRILAGTEILAVLTFRHCFYPPKIIGKSRLVYKHGGKPS
jgi:hypothetical protein